MLKTAIVTGASRGIGAAIAYKLASKGYSLSLCCSKSIEDLESLSTDIMEHFNVDVICFQGNVGDFSFVSRMVEDTVKRFGHIDVLVNNAGISHLGLFTDMSIDEWNEILSTNLTSVFSFCKQTVPYMVSEKKGKILQISSVWGNVGASCEVAYSACKGGMNSFTKALGKELAPSNIQVNAIACGVIDTEMNKCFSEDERTELALEIPAGRFATPEEVAELAYDIIKGNNYLTGQVITLDGGWT